MGLETAAVLGIGQAVSSGIGMFSSFSQASEQRDKQAQAEAAAAKSMEEARKKLEVNYYKGLSIQKEPYELEREALNVSGAQAMDAAREGETRGVGATAGRVQMAENVGQRNIATAQGKEMSDLEKLTAQEGERLKDIGTQLDLNEASGAQVAASRAGNLATAATTSAMGSMGNLINQGASFLSLYSKKPNDTSNVAGATGGLDATADNGYMPNYISNPNGITVPYANGNPNAPKIPFDVHNNLQDLANKYPEYSGLGSIQYPQLNNYLQQQTPDYLKNLDFLYNKHYSPLSF